MQTKKENGKIWNSASITQFELAKLIYTSGFLKNVNLTATSKLVLMALVQHYNANNADMFPSQKFLAKQLGISEKSVERSICNLKTENLIYYITKKVNRYRFTAKFFELIKMSVNNRQNVGSDVRQNVGQTNNDEKINKKENFLNFSGNFDKLQENTGKSDCNFASMINENGVKTPQIKNENKFLMKNSGKSVVSMNNFKKNKNAAFSKNEIVSPCAKFENLTGRAEEMFAENPAMQAKNGYMGSDNKNANIAQNDGSAWLSPLDFEIEDALLWVQSLPIQLKQSNFARKLCEKYNFSDEDIYSDAQKEKILQYSENPCTELSLQNEKFI